MSSQIVCSYSAIAVGSLTPAQLVGRMGAAPVDASLLSLYSLTVSSDTTGAVGATVTRTISLAMSPAFKALFPDGTDQAAPVANWMTEVLGAALQSGVVAASPVVS
jgi:hypothetical protein